MKHKSLLVYVPCPDGGCEDVGRIELARHTLVSDERLWELEKAEQAADELESLQRYRTAFNKWIDKTEWVQADTTLPAKYLGMHRADALKDMISELEKRCDELSADKGTWYRMSEVFSKRITEVETALKASEERCAVLTDALRLAVRPSKQPRHVDDR